MNLRTGNFAIVALWALLAAGCQDGESDRPASRPEATEPSEPQLDSTTPETEPATEPGTQPGTPTLDAPATATDAQPDPSEDVVEDLESVLEEIAVLERDAQFFKAFTRVRDVSRTYRGRPEAKELASLQQRLYQYHSRSSGLDYAIRQLGSDSTMAVSVAAEKLFGAGEVGAVFLRKAVRQAESKTAAAAAELLIEQNEPQITRLMVERMEKDPPEPLSDDLGKLLQRLDTIESEWIDRLCALARREGSSRAGAVDVLIGRLERSIRTQLETAKPNDAQPEDAQPETAEKEQPEPAPIEVDPRLVRTLYDVALAADGTLQRQAVEALVLVLEEVNQRDARAFNQLAGSEEAYGFVGDYVVANLEGEQIEDRLWAAPRAAPLHLQAPGFWARIQPDDDETVLYERLDLALSFGDINQLRATGPVEKEQTVRWTGFLDVPASGEYTFSVDCVEQSNTVFLVEGEQTAPDKKVELSAGWHEVGAEMSLSGDVAKLSVAWEGPNVGKQDIPADRVVCTDRTRTLIWRLGRKCELAEARSLAAQLLPSIKRIDEQLIETLTLLAQVDNPARPAVAAMLGEVLDYSIANAPAALEWEPRALSVLLDATEGISGPEQRRVVASLVNHLVRRAGKNLEEFNRIAESTEAYADVRAFIAERLDDEDPGAARWAMQHAGAFGLGLEGWWVETLDAPDGSAVRERYLESELNFGDMASLNNVFPVKVGQAIRWSGFLRCAKDGAYVINIEAAKESPVKMTVAGQTIESGKSIKLAMGIHPIDVQLTIGPDAKLLVRWLQPGATEPELISRKVFACPAWAKLLTWQLQQKPTAAQAETICARLSRMADQIDHASLGPQLQAMIEPDSPLALPVAEVLARVVSNGHMDDTYERSLAAPLSPLLPKAEGERKRILVGSLITIFDRLFSKKEADFDAAAKAPKLSQQLRDFVTERLDAKELPVRLWAAKHADPFGLLGSGLEGSYFDAGFKTRLFDRIDTRLYFEPGQFSYPDKRTDDIGVRWSGLVDVPLDGDYIFSCTADDRCRLWLDDQPVVEDSKKPATATLTRGRHEIRVEFVDATGLERIAINWQQPGQNQPQEIRTELRYANFVQLLTERLTRRPGDPQAAAWLTELSYKTDRLDAASLDKLVPLAQKNAALKNPLASVLAAAILRDPHKAPPKAAPQLSQTAPDLTGTVRRRAVEALVAYCSVVCGRDKTRYQQAVGVPEAYDFLSKEIQSSADSGKAADTEWARQQGEILGLKLASPDE